MFTILTCTHAVIYLYYGVLTDFRKTGEWKPIKGKAYSAKQAKTHGDTYKQEAVSIVLLLQTDYPLT
jgi:hypothetical protein